eukprot:30878-Pelagococcus_subviridis.AAC.3
MGRASNDARSNDTSRPLALAARVAARHNSGRYNAYPSTCNSAAPVSASSVGKSLADIRNDAPR